MTPAEIARIKTDPRFMELERRRNAFSWTLFVVICVIYFGFIALVAYGGALAATPVWGVITLAFPIGLAVIVLAIVLTGVYVLKANGDYDTLTRDLVAGLAQRRPVR